MYNIFFTGAPPIAIGLFDQNCKAETRINNPHLYKSSQKSDQFNNKIFWLWILLAVLHSLTLYFIPLGTFKYGIVWSSGLGGDYLVIGNVVYSCVILTVSAKALLILDSWNMWTSIAIFGSVIFWFLFLIVYSYFWPMGLGMAANMAGMIELIASTPFFWLSLLLGNAKVIVYLAQNYIGFYYSAFGLIAPGYLRQSRYNNHQTHRIRLDQVGRTKQLQSLH